MKRNLVLFSCLLLLGTSAAFGQSTYQVTTVPTFVINTGRAEVLGGIRITATNAGPTVASTIQYTYQGVACDNTPTTGIVLTLDNTVFTAANTTIQTVTNTSVGCVVAVAVNGGIATTATAFIEIDGVRGRVDMLGGITNVGSNINGSLSATPSNSSLFTVPNQGVVGITAVGLFVDSVKPGNVLQCVGNPANPEPQIKLHEGFNGAFVQHVITVAGSAVPAAARPVYGGTNNTEIHFHVASQPTGVSLAWPALVDSNELPAYVAGVQGSELQLLPSSTATDVVYEYACGSQAICDITTESFTFNLILTATATSSFGTATVGTQLYPPLITGDAVVITDPPFNVAEPRPRFNDPLRGPSAIDTNGPCRTNLLFPWMAFISASGYDTGFAISNTSTDPYGTVAQQGTCALNFYPGAAGTTPTAGTAVVVTTANIPSGAVYATNISNIATLNTAPFTGYMIAVCNFQYGHGFGFITNAISSPNALAQGYIALIIPDPVINVGRLTTNGFNEVGNSGEGLTE
ncbi:MAG TPA: hypothetical protein VKV95_18395 [Terriglobia bacterium]|nr:hypothetical protein [Terriglobia bacterium]